MSAACANNATELKSRLKYADIVAFDIRFAHTESEMGDADLLWWLKFTEFDACEEQHLNIVWEIYVLFTTNASLLKSNNLTVWLNN